TGQTTQNGADGGSGKPVQRRADLPKQADEGHAGPREGGASSAAWGFSAPQNDKDSGSNPGQPGSLPPTAPPAPTPPQNSPAGGAGGTPGPKAETAKNSAASGASGPPKRGKHPVHFPPPGQQDGSTTGAGGSAPPSGGGGGSTALGLGQYE